MSPQRFASAYRIPLPTLKNWEQGGRYPDAPAAAYLLAIKRKPKEVLEAVAGCGYRSPHERSDMRERMSGRLRDPGFRCASSGLRLLSFR